MSYSTVYAIDANGDVIHAGEARNNHGFAPFVWDVLAGKTGVPLRVPGSFGAINPEFWKILYSGKLSERDDLILASTYDHAYVKKENLRPLAQALRSFYEEHGRKHTPSGPSMFKNEPFEVAPTMLGVADILDEIAEDATNRGACFNLCSANENPWVVRFRSLSSEEQEEEILEMKEQIATEIEEERKESKDFDERDFIIAACEDDPRPFNFDKDVGHKRIYEGEPCEIGDREKWIND